MTIPDSIVKPVSLTDQVTAAIRQAILKGDLQPGDRIVEQTMAKMYGVGQNVVRESLIALSHQGFVRRVANRATYVNELTMEQAERMATVRDALEALAVQLVLDRYKKGEVSFEKLQEHLETMRAAAHRFDRDAFYAADLLFHQELWRLSGNEYLGQMLEQLVVPLFAFFVLLFFRKDDQLKMLPSALPTHDHLVDRLIAGDEEGCREAVRQLVGFSVKHQHGLLAEADGAATSAAQ